MKKVEGEYRPREVDKALEVCKILESVRTGGMQVVR
jgi:hypothetical protein